MVFVHCLTFFLYISLNRRPAEFKEDEKEAPIDMDFMLGELKTTDTSNTYSFSGDVCSTPNLSLVSYLFVTHPYLIIERLVINYFDCL